MISKVIACTLTAGALVMVGCSTKNSDTYSLQGDIVEVVDKEVQNYNLAKEYIAYSGDYMIDKKTYLNVHRYEKISEKRIKDTIKANIDIPALGITKDREYKIVAQTASGSAIITSEGGKDIEIMPNGKLYNYTWEGNKNRYYSFEEPFVVIDSKGDALETVEYLEDANSMIFLNSKEEGLLTVRYGALERSSERDEKEIAYHDLTLKIDEEGVVSFKNFKIRIFEAGEDCVKYAILAD